MQRVTSGYGISAPSRPLCLVEVTIPLFENCKGSRSLESIYQALLATGPAWTVKNLSPAATPRA